MVTETLRVIGTAEPQVEGPEKVTGACDYAADITLPGMLWTKTLRSPYPHARIVRIDTSRAHALPGVRAVVTGADLPPVLLGLQINDMPMLAVETVRFIGEQVAAVVASDEETAEQALSLIEVEYEELPAVFDPLQAMQPGSPLVHSDPAAYAGALLPIPEIPNVSSRLEITHGDVEQGLAESDRVFGHTFTISGTHQGYIEPRACAVSVKPDGSAEVWASTKSIFSVRSMLSKTFGVPDDQIRVYSMHVGGDFGGKNFNPDMALAYFLSQQTGRPVKIVMSYTDEITAGNIRHPAVVTLRTGVKNDGRLWAQDAHVVYDSGAYAAFKPSGNLRGFVAAGGVYRIPHLRAASTMVYTNHVPGGFMRAPGAPQVIYAVESQVDMIARELGIDPLEFRRINALREGDVSASGERLQQIHCLEALDEAAAAAGWEKPKPPNVGRGLALYHRKPGGGHSSVRITLKSGEGVTVLTSTPDQGTGIYTVLRQVVAEVLGLPPEAVSVRTGSTDDLPPEPGVGGSKSTHVTGQAAAQAAEELQDRLLQVAASLLDIYAEDIEPVVGGFRRRDEPSGALALSFATVAEETLRREGGPIEIPHTYTAPKDLPLVAGFCAQVAEVEVDPETGQVKLRKVTSAHRIGQVINTLGHQGQIDGGIMQAVGYALMEEIQVSEGAVQDANLGEYKLPTTRDIPELRTVLLPNWTGPAPFAGSAIGEIPNIPLAAAVANAVEDAAGVRITSLPITAEKVYQALQQRPDAG